MQQDCRNNEPIVFLYIDINASWKIMLSGKFSFSDYSHVLQSVYMIRFHVPRVWLRAVIGHWLHFSVARFQHITEIDMQCK